MNTQDFKFFMPFDIEKGKNKTGEEVMKIKGLASTASKDSQGEVLDPNGFDLSNFSQINWNHLGKSDPSTIVGEPTKTEIRNNNLFIEGELYPEVPMAKAIWNLMKAYKNSKKGNKLGLSVEGKVLERDSTNKSKITKAKITGVAICPHPVNGDAFVDLVEKGFTNNDWTYEEDTLDEIEKAFTQEENLHTTKESIDGVNDKDKEEEEKNKKSLLKKLTKGETYQKIFSYFYGIEIEKAQKIYSLIEKISKMKNKEITEETIKKAFEILESSDETISKAKETMEKAKETMKKAKDKEEEDDDDDKEMVEMAKSSIKKYVEKGVEKGNIINKMVTKGFNKSIVEKAMDLVTTGDGGGVGGGVKKSQDFSQLTDLIEKSNTSMNEKFSALADIFKSQNEQITSLSEKLEKSFSTIETLQGKIESITKSSPGKKSVTTEGFVERFKEDGFAKSEDGKQVYSLKDNNSRKALINRLTEISNINKSDTFDEELIRIAQDVEISKSVTPRALSRLKALNIELV